MLPTLITLACLWLCPTDADFNYWQDGFHPPDKTITVVVEPKLHAAAIPQPSRQPSTPPPDPPPSSPGVEQWRSLVTAHFLADQVERALCIMDAESGGDPGANNPNSSAAGLFQFLRSTWDVGADGFGVPIEVTGGSYDSGQVYQPEANIRAAAWLSTNVGWSQWSPYQRGACH